MLFISGQMACDEKGLPIVEPELGFPYSFRAAQHQMKYIVENIAAICEAAGTTIENICRRQALFTDLREFEPTWEVWRSMFKELPAETTLGVSAPLLSRGCTIYADVMAYAP
jgi:enamine deaminase RidA (YjgF/YER057c/UK114 family)